MRFHVREMRFPTLGDNIHTYVVVDGFSSGASYYFAVVCFLPSRGFSYCSLFCDHGLDFGEIS